MSMVISEPSMIRLTTIRHILDPRSRCTVSSTSTSAWSSASWTCDSPVGVGVNSALQCGGVQLDLLGAALAPFGRSCVREC